MKDVFESELLPDEDKETPDIMLELLKLRKEIRKIRKKQKHDRKKGKKHKKGKKNKSGKKGKHGKKNKKKHKLPQPLSQPLWGDILKIAAPKFLDTFAVIVKSRLQQQNLPLPPQRQIHYLPPGRKDGGDDE